VKNPTRKKKTCVKNRRKKINGSRKTMKSWNGKALIRVSKRKGTRIDWSRARRSVNRKRQDWGSRNLRKSPNEIRIIQQQIGQMVVGALPVIHDLLRDEAPNYRKHDAHHVAHRR
jgi:hypothetical protein